MNCKPMTEKTRRMLHKQYGHLFPEDSVKEKNGCHYCENTELSPSDCPVCRGNGERDGGSEE